MVVSDVLTLNAIYELMNKKGFSLIAVEMNKCFFYIKNNLAKNFEILSPEESWKSADRNNSQEQIEFIKNSVKNFNFK